MKKNKKLLKRSPVKEEMFLNKEKMESQKEYIMRYNEFIKTVQGYCGINDKYEAENIIKATLQTLTERLSIEEAKHISSQLPFELKNYMNFDPSEGFSVEEFYKRVAEREGVDENTAKRHSKAVLTVLDEAISSGEISHIKAQLPEEFIEIFPEEENRDDRY